MPALHLLLTAGGHAVVSQIIKAEFTVRAVGDIALVLLASQLGHLVVLNDPHAEPNESVELSHPLGVALGEVVIHCHHMHTASRKGIQINSQCADECLAFASRHLSNTTAMQHHATDELHVEMNHVPYQGISAHHELASTQATRAIFHHREGLGENCIQLGGQHVGVGNFR